MNIDLETKVSGEYRIEIINKFGDVINDSGFFKNLITNNGLNLRATTANTALYCQVGTGSATPSFTDTTLSSYLASQSGSSTLSNSPSSPFYTQRSVTYTFPVGAVVGNITEIGVSPTSGSGNLFSRALILDGSGNPTSMTILSSEQLRVTYVFRIYAPLNDVTGTIDISGKSYSYTIRAGNLTSLSYFSTDYSESNASPAPFATNGSIGAITSIPSGTIVSISMSAGSYINGSYSINHTISASASQGNLSGGISALFYTSGSISFQIGFSPAIPKTSLNAFSLTVNHSWSRI